MQPLNSYVAGAKALNSITLKHLETKEIGLLCLLRVATLFSDETWPKQRLTLLL